MPPNTPLKLLWLIELGGFVIEEVGNSLPTYAGHQSVDGLGIQRVVQKCPNAKLNMKQTESD